MATVAFDTGSRALSNLFVFNSTLGGSPDRYFPN